MPAPAAPPSSSSTMAMRFFEDRRLFWVNCGPVVSGAASLQAGLRPNLTASTSYFQVADVAESCCA